MDLIEDQVWCDVHGEIHDKTCDPYQYGDENPECSPEDWRKVWVGRRVVMEEGGMKSEDYWMDQLSTVRKENARLKTEIDQAIGILYGGLDRDRDKDDSLRTLCVVLVNALARERSGR
jgi:hypothetical protein